MLLVSRPLTLLALAICTYVTITWHLRSSAIQVSKIVDEYDENGFTRYDPEEWAAKKEGNGRPGKIAAPEKQQTILPVTVGAGELASQTAAKSIGVEERPSMTRRPAVPLPTLKPIEHEQYMNDILDWERPKHKNGHWPPYEDFAHQDYDPNRWEAFKL